MKISEHQLLIVLDTLRGSLTLADGGTLFGYNIAMRTKIYNEIINQSETALVEIGTLSPAKETDHADE